MQHTSQPCDACRKNFGLWYREVRTGKVFVYEGIMDNSADYYHVMRHKSTGRVVFLTCVSTPEMMGFRALSTKTHPRMQLI